MWNGFIRDLCNGSFGTALARAAESGMPGHFCIRAHTPIVGGGFRPPRDVVILASRDAEALSTVSRDLGTPEQHLTAAADSSTLAKLGEALTRLKNRDWVWVEVYVGHTFQASTLHDVTALDARQIWERFLSFFEDWLQ
jgi:hypothetical protein